MFNAFRVLTFVFFAFSTNAYAGMYESAFDGYNENNSSDTYAYYNNTHYGQQTFLETGVDLIEHIEFELVFSGNANPQEYGNSNSNTMTFELFFDEQSAGTIQVEPDLYLTSETFPSAFYSIELDNPIKALDGDEHWDFRFQSVTSSGTGSVRLFPSNPISFGAPIPEPSSLLIMLTGILLLNLRLKQ